MNAFRFGRFALDPKRRSLKCDGASVALTPKAFDILLYLVEHPNRVVTKQDLMKAVWPDTFVEEGNLTQNMSLLRKALGESSDDPLIVTVSRQGYQFTADVTQMGVLEEPQVAEVPLVSGGIRSAAALGLPAVESAVATSKMETRTRAEGVTRRRYLAAAGTAIAGLLGALVIWQPRKTVAPDANAVRLAVLPFVNLTGDSSQDYLADGLTEELTTHLARLRPERLAIIARTSAMRYKHARKRIDEIGRDLDIAFAIESSMRRTADGLRVTVQLIRVRDQSHLWANDFDYRRPDPIGLEDSVAGAVGRAVQLRLTDADRTRLTHGTSTNAQAVDAVMHGREVAYRQMSKDSWEGAKRYFEQAVALDSSYALAWAWLSSSYRMGTDAGYLPPDSGIRLARHAVDRALTEDPEVPEAWRQKGQLARLVDWDWTTAMASYQRALDLDPGNAATMLDVAAMESALGHHDEALPLVKRAVVLNPQDANAIEQLGGQYFQAGQLDSAAIVTERIPPYLRNGVWNSDLVQVYLAQGRISEAAVLAAQAPDPFWNLFARALVEAHRGWRRRPDSTLAAFIAQYQSDAPYQVAVIYAIGGQPDSAFFWLDRAYTTRDQGLAEVKVDVLLASLRPDPRYRVLLAKMRLPL